MKRFYYETLQNYNHLINEENTYFNNTPQFDELAEQFPSLKQFIGTNQDNTIYYKWEKPNATKELTKALLKKDFNIDWDIPDTHLCPGLTGRINYINWIHQILNIVPQDQNKESAAITGIDIGTGASCIYPILGYCIYKMSFIATDIDKESITSSEHILSTNGLNSHIQVLLRTQDQPLLTDIVESSSKPIAFCMCNPPFFDNEDEWKTNPRNACTAVPNELFYKGGEVAFVTRIIEESCQLQDKIHLYSSLVGRKKSLRSLLRLLREKQIHSVATSVLYQGKTCRWVLCWSFDPKFEIEFNKNPLKYKVFGKKKLEKQRNEIEFIVHESEDSIWSHIYEFSQACEGVMINQTDEITECVITNYQYHFPGDSKHDEKKATGEMDETNVTNEKKATNVTNEKKATNETNIIDEKKATNKTHETNEKKEIECSFYIDVDEEEECTTIGFQLHNNKNRKLFFIVAEQLKSDIERTNRRWRRFLKKKEKA